MDSPPYPSSTDPSPQQARDEGEQRFRFLAAAVPVGIFRADADGLIVYINPHASEILGLKPEEALGDAWQAQLHPADRERVAAAWHAALREGGLCRSEYRLLRADGSISWVHVQAATETADDGRRIGYVGTVTDITEQKRVEADLQRTSDRLRGLAAHMASVREEESRKLAAEVHDSLGGSLNMLKLGLATFLEKMEPEDPMRARIESLMALAEETIRMARSITARLRPRMLDTLGLVAAIRATADELSRMTGIRCELQLPQYIRLAPERAAAVFRVFQEGVTNAARHAGAATIVVKAAKSRTHLLLSISDDGRGIAVSDIEKQDSYGILGMNERSQYLGGSLEIVGAPGRGTTVTLRVPFES